MKTFSGIIANYFTSPMQVIVLIVITLVAFGLRAHQYWVVPLSDETADELAWTWLGASLLQDGQPTSWSYYEQYEPNFVYQRDVVTAPLVRPAVDHPPLFSFIPGSLHSITSAEWQTIPSRKVIRFPMVILGTINVILLYFVARRMFQPSWALITMALYATIPVFVLSSRLVVAENLLVTWMLASIVAVDSLLSRTTKHKSIWTAAVLVLCVLALLTKISGIVIPLSVIAAGLWKRQAQLVRIGVAGLIVGIGVLLLYMTATNLPLFLSIQAAQADRLLGLTTLFSRFFVHPVVAELYYLDGWLALGLISAVVWLATNNSEESNSLSFVKLFFVVSLGFIVTTVEEFSYHGWYNYVLFPFFALSLTHLCQKIYQSKPLLMLVSWILFLPTASVVFSQLQMRDQINNLLIRFLYGIGGIPLFAEVLQRPRLVKHTMVVLFGIVLLVNSIAVFSITELSVREHNNYHFFVLPDTTQ